MKQPISVHKTTVALMLMIMLCHSISVPAGENPSDMYDLDLEQLLQIKVETLNKRP
jgi:hypothetical protein